ncbi:MAG: response regulator transcription factor [bacterium]|nr:response regulator transcription factor [bacterium]
MIDVLIIEDDADIALSLKHYIERQGEFRVSVSGDGERGIEQARRDRPHLILLDLNLPGVDGMEVCRRLRDAPETESVPVIMLTARVDERDKLQGLELGADDYITKPFSVKEVVARVRAVLRRAPTADDASATLRLGGLELDPGSRRVHCNGAEVTLTRMEFDLLAELLNRRGRVLTREALLEQVWGYDHPGTTRTVDVHVRQLRKKLGPAVAARIETVIGVGYRMSDD